MKDHVKTDRTVTSSGSVSGLIDELAEIDVELLNATYSVWEEKIEIEGWRPMTSEELIYAEQRRVRERARKRYLKEKKEEKERAEYERLRRKFEDSSLD